MNLGFIFLRLADGLTLDVILPKKHSWLPSFYKYSQNGKIYILV